MKKRFFTPHLLGACLLVVGCSGKSPKSEATAAAPVTAGTFTRTASYEPLPGLHVQHYRDARSGLELLVSPQPGTDVVAFVTAYNVGSRFEMKGRTGLAHLFEHMMFRGTENFPEPFKTLSSWGDRFNAYTSFDLTLYHELVPKKLFPEAARFEAERMRKLLITPEGFNAERGAVVSERKMRTEDSPFGRLIWELYQLAYDKHPYKTGPIGWQEDLDATTFQDALDFYKRFYAPNRAVLVVVGDVTPEEAVKTIQTHYGSFEKQPFDAPVVPREPPRKGLRRKVIPMKAESVFIGDAVFGPTFHDPDVAVDSLLASLFGDGKIGYLAGELVEKGLARSVSSDAAPSVDPGLSGVFIVGNPGVPLKTLERAYDRARGGFLKWLTAERLESLKLYYLAGQWGGLRDPMTLAEQLGRASVTAGDPTWEFSFLERAKKVTLADIERRWKVWNTAARTRVIIEPSNKTAPLRRKGAK
jgi:zinc protease